MVMLGLWHLPSPFLHPCSLQDAAPSLFDTSAASTGIYVGCVWNEYQALHTSHQLAPSIAALTGSGLNFLVGRISYSFGFQGMPAQMGRMLSHGARNSHAMCWTHSCLPLFLLLQGPALAWTPPARHRWWLPTWATVRCWIGRPAYQVRAVRDEAVEAAIHASPSS